MLEPDEAKLSSPVLRGLSGRKAARLPGEANRSDSFGQLEPQEFAFDTDLMRHAFSIYTSCLSLYIVSRFFEFRRDYTRYDAGHAI